MCYAEHEKVGIENQRNEWNCQIKNALERLERRKITNNSEF